jgi:PAS domain S-box-containing protein
MRGGMAVALSRVRARASLPYTCRVALATSAAGWPAAAYGALAIAFAGNFESTGSAWIFGFPFLGLLTIATLLHLLAMGLGEAVGIPVLHAGMRAVNRALDGPGRPQACSDADLFAATTAIARLPLWDVAQTGCLSLAVVLGCEALERMVAGPGSPHFGLIARSGLIACAIYVSAGLVLAELVVRPGCRALRREALQRRVRLPEPFTLARPYRLLATIVPPVAALAVAVEIGCAANATAAAYGLLVGLSVVVTVALAWLHSESQVRGAREIVEASRALAAGEDVRLVTGSIDPSLVAVASAFSAAAHRVGAARRASSERYRALFDGASDAIVLVDVGSGRIVEASVRAERLFGVPRHELVGRGFTACLDAPTAERLREFALEERHRAEAALVNVAIVRADGTAIPVDLSIAIVAAGEERLLQAIVRDVRGRLRVEAELRKAARRFEELYRLAVVLGDDPRALADHTVGALTALLECPRAQVHVLGNGALRTLAASPAADDPMATQALAGTPAGEIVAQGRPCVVADVAARFPAAHALVAAGVRAYCGVPMLDGEGAVVGIVGVADVRERVFRDEDVQLLASFAQRIGQALARERLSAERDALTARVVESDRVKSEFLGMMSHELRTPLNILLGYARMLLEAIDEGDVMTVAERRDVCERILAGGLHLGDLVEDTLSVLRLEAGVVQVSPEPLVLRAFFEELQGADRLLRRPSEVVERWLVDDDVPSLMTDRRKLRQVLTNLVGNARKFTERGVIEIRASAGVAGGVRVSVRDTGCGIDAAHLPFVFDLYRQAPNERRHDGCGLGLYIVRRYVELLGGRVSCTSRVGVGTTFVVDLPAAVAAPSAVAA